MPPRFNLNHFSDQAKESECWKRTNIRTLTVVQWLQKSFSWLNPSQITLYMTLLKVSKIFSKNKIRISTNQGSNILNQWGVFFRPRKKRIQWQWMFNHFCSHQNRISLVYIWLTQSISTPLRKLIFSDSQSKIRGPEKMGQGTDFTVGLLIFGKSLLYGICSGVLIISVTLGTSLLILWLEIPFKFS